MNPPVVVGVDGSEAARDAAIWAAREALSRGCSLLLLHVVRWPLYAEAYLAHPAAVLGVEPLRESGEEIVEDVRRRCLSHHPEVVIDELVEVGDPAEVILRVSADAAVVVIGSTGSGSLSRLFLGSTAADVLRQCEKPVVVVRETDDAPERRVIAGVDSSLNALPALGFAFDFAARHGAKLVAVHTWSDVPLDLVLRERSVDVDVMRGHARMVVSEAINGLAKKHPDVSTRIVVASERPADALIEEAEGAELLVVGSHGRGPVRRALLGSVSHAVVQEASCPVAVVRAR